MLPLLTGMRSRTAIAVLFGLLTAACAPAQRAYQRLWEERLREMDPPAIVEDDADPLDPADQQLFLGNPYLDFRDFPAEATQRLDRDDRRALENYARAALLMQNADPGQALDEYLDSSRRSESLWIRLRAAEAALRLNNISRGERLLQDILEDHPAEYRALLLLGDVHLLRRQYGDAKRAYERVVAEKPNNVDALESLAQIALQIDRDLDAARDYADRILRIDDGNLNAMLWKAETSAALGQPELAADYYEQLIRYRPTLIDTMREMARRLAAGGRFNDAIILYERALLIEPGRTNIRNAWEELVRNQHGVEGVRTAYERLLDQNPTNLDLAETFADYLAQQGATQRLLELRREILAIDPDHTPSLLALARNALTRDDTDTAEIYLQQAERAHPNDPETLREIGLVWLGNDRHERALPYLQRSAQLDPASVQSLLALAAIAQRNGDLDSAERHLRNAIDTSPANPTLLRQLATVYEQRGEPTRAAELYQGAIAADSTDLVSWISLAEIHFEREDTAALDQLEQQALDKLRDFPQFDISYGILAREFGEYERSRRALERALRVVPDDLAARRALAETYLLLSLPDLAIEAIRDARPHIDGRPEAQFTYRRLLADVMIEARRHDDAASVLASLIADYPDNIGLREQYLLTLVELDDESLLRNETNRFVRDFSIKAPVETQRTRARVLVARGEAPRAVSLLKDLSDDHPGNNEIIFDLALAASQANDIPTAERAYRKLLEIGPPPDNTYFETAANNLGYLFAQNNTRLDEAEQLILQALALNPRAPHVLDSLGYVYLQQGRLDKARQYLEKAARLSGRDAEILTNLGQVYQRLGEKELARATYDRAISLDPDDQRPRELLRTLAE